MSADVEKQKRSSENDNDNLNNMSNSSYYSSGTTSEERILKSSKERRSSNDRGDDERKNLRSRAESSDYRGGSLECNRSSRSRRKTSDFDNHCRSRRSSRSRSRDRTLTNHSGSLNRQTLDSSSNAGSEKAFEDEAPKRARRTGWDTTASAAASATAAGPSFSQLSPTSTGFTASLTGRTPEQIQAELAERQAQAAAVATSMQAKASLHQLCRIYVGSLDYSLSDTDIRQVFSAFGPIVNIDMPKEGNRSKGFCFVEYTTPESADMALQTMVGFNLKGRSIKVGRPTALGGQQPLGSAVSPSVPLVSSSAAALKPGGLNAAEAGQMAAAMLLGRADGIGGYDAQNRVYVGSVPYTFTAEDIKQIFDVFGSILSCQLIPSNERPGTHRGYGFIEYATHEQAKLAIETMNDFPVAGKVLKVNYATALRGPTGLPLLECSPSPTSSSPIVPQIPSLAATGANAIPVAPPVPSVPSVPSVPAAVLVPPTIAPSPILLLCNMVDPEEANEEVKEEIQAECSKYGNISQIKIVVDDQQKEVRIFVAFSSPAECSVALPALHDRWFGGRKITACYYDPDTFAKGVYW